MFKKILSNFFWNYYDHAGTLVLINVAWFFWTLINVYIFSGQAKAAMPALVLTAGVPLCGIYYVCNKIIENQEIRFRDFLKGLAKLSLKSALLVIFDAALLAVIIFNLSFYRDMSDTYPRLAFILGACVLSFLIIFILANQFAFAVTAKSGYLAPKALITSVKVALGFLPTTAMLLLQTVCFVFLSLVSLVGVALFLVTAVILLQSEALHNIAMKAEGKWDEVPWVKGTRTIRQLFNPRK